MRIRPIATLTLGILSYLMCQGFFPCAGGDNPEEPGDSASLKSRLRRINSEKSPNSGELQNGEQFVLDGDCGVSLESALLVARRSDCTGDDKKRAGKDSAMLRETESGSSSRAHPQTILAFMQSLPTSDSEGGPHDGN